jgi:LmbE family N-acetylglucosaminyl deacetylase
MHLNKATKGVLLTSAAIMMLTMLKREFEIKLKEAADKAVENGRSIAEGSGRVLAISAHPDDLEFFAGGLLKLLHSKGHEVHIIDVTDGEKGVRVKNLAEIRRKEQLESGTALGIQNIEFLHLPDMRLEQLDNLNLIFKEHIERIRPDIVLTFDYSKPIRAIVHPDHMKVGKSTMEAVGLCSGKRPALLYYASREPNTVVDVSSVLSKKIRAVLSHRSQIRFSSRPYASAVKAFARYNTLNTGLKYAESFRR